MFACTSHGGLLDALFPLFVFGLGLMPLVIPLGLLWLWESWHATPQEPDGLVYAALAKGTAARCGVCNADIAEEGFWCGRCEMPHHGDCWSYNGGCARYGCTIK
jgi:hypothetical protein